MGNTYNRVYIWCCKYGENRYCERCAKKKLCASKHTGLLNSCLGKPCLHPYLVVPLISARVTLISTRVSAHCQAILLLTCKSCMASMARAHDQSLQFFNMIFDIFLLQDFSGHLWTATLAQVKVRGHLWLIHHLVLIGIVTCHIHHPVGGMSKNMGLVGYYIITYLVILCLTCNSIAKTQELTCLSTSSQARRSTELNSFTSHILGPDSV